MGFNAGIVSGLAPGGVAVFPRTLQVQGNLTITDASSHAVIAAQSGRIAVTHIHVSNTSGTAVRVDVQDGSTTIWSTEVAASGGGAEADFSVPLYGSPATALNAIVSSAVTDIRITVVGYVDNNS